MSLVEYEAALARLYLLFKETGMTMAQAQKVANNKLNTARLISDFIEIEEQARKEVQSLAALYKQLFPTRHSKPNARNRAIYNRAKQLYLQGANWQRIKRARIDKAHGLCEAQMQGCTGKAQAVHHLSYAHLGDEAMWDLRAVCSHCHNKVSKWGKS